MFGWLRRKRALVTERPKTAVFRFDRVDAVKPSPKYGNSGPEGWGFTLWGSPDGEEFMYRHLLETFATQNPDAPLKLPEWCDCEDFIEGELTWNSQQVYIWYETVLSYLWLWSAEVDAIDSLRSAMLPMVKPR